MMYNININYLELEFFVKDNDIFVIKYFERLRK